MPNPASIADIEVRFRPLAGQERVNAEVFLEDAWWMLTSRRPTLEDNMEALTVSERNVTRVVTNMVIRVLRNPEGYLEEAVDDVRFRRDSLVSSGALHVTASEMADITPGRQGIHSVRLVAYGGD